MTLIPQQYELYWGMFSISMVTWSWLWVQYISVKFLVNVHVNGRNVAELNLYVYINVSLCYRVFDCDVLEL